MIINFTVGNYRSFKDKKVLSMEATAIKELNESVIEKEGYRLLPSAVTVSYTHLTLPTKA